MAKIFFSININEAKRLSHLLKTKKIRRIYHGVYTDDRVEPIHVIVKKHWMEIVSFVISNGILSFRTAVELKPIPYPGEKNIIFMTSSYEKTIEIANLIVKVYKGNYQAYIDQILPNLAKSNVPRMLLENLVTVRKPQFKGVKTIGKVGVEKYLARELQSQGEMRLNQIRDEAKEISQMLGYKKEEKILNQIISALLATNSIFHLETTYAKAIAKKEPYDANRLYSFETLAMYLKKCFFKSRNYHFSTSSFRNLSFFESYFSNFIEGTEFLIDEAEDIVFKGVEINHRHADSHDVLANFYITNDYSEMHKTPNDPSELLNILKSRHSFLMKERPEVNPGEFKTKPNKAGNSFFVAPENVVGTLTQGFEIYQLLEDGFAKALFMHYLITEVHPFIDGNGRLARIMLNAELVKAGLVKIIIPTVHRDNYLTGLRRATREQHFYTYCKAMDQAQAYTASIPWPDYGAAREKIEADEANKTPDEGLPIFNRTLRTLPLSEFSNT